MMQQLYPQLEAVCRRFEELTTRLNQPQTAADPMLFRRLMQEYHDAEPVVQACRAWQTAQNHLAQAKALLEGETLEPDFKQMVQQELSEKARDVEELENNLKLLLLPKDQNDEKSVILEVRSGAGGEEAALFAHSLVRMYTMYAQARGWQMETLTLSETELGGVREAILEVNGRGVYHRLKFESGVHRVQRVPETETQGRIHTSTATVAVMSQAEDVEIKDPAPRTCASTPSGLPVPEDSISIRLPPPSASPTCPPAWWWSARMSAVSSKIKIKPWRIIAPFAGTKTASQQQQELNANRPGRWVRGTAQEVRYL